MAGIIDLPAYWGTLDTVAKFSRCVKLLRPEDCDRFSREIIANGVPTAIDFIVIWDRCVKKKGLVYSTIASALTKWLDSIDFRVVFQTDPIVYGDGLADDGLPEVIYGGRSSMPSFFVGPDTEYDLDQLPDTAIQSRDVCKKFLSSIKKKLESTEFRILCTGERVFFYEDPDIFFTPDDLPESSDHSPQESRKVIVSLAKWLNVSIFRVVFHMDDGRLGDVSLYVEPKFEFNLRNIQEFTLFPRKIYEEIILHESRVVVLVLCRGYRDLFTGLNKVGNYDREYRKLESVIFTEEPITDSNRIDPIYYTTQLLSGFAKQIAKDGTRGIVFFKRCFNYICKDIKQQMEILHEHVWDQIGLLKHLYYIVKSASLSYQPEQIFLWMYQTMSRHRVLEYVKVTPLFHIYHVKVLRRYFGIMDGILPEWTRNRKPMGYTLDWMFKPVLDEDFRLTVALVSRVMSYREEFLRNNPDDGAERFDAMTTYLEKHRKPTRNLKTEIVSVQWIGYPWWGEIITDYNGDVTQAKKDLLECFVRMHKRWMDFCELYVDTQDPFVYDEIDDM